MCARVVSFTVSLSSLGRPLGPLKLYLRKERGIYAACLAFIGGVNILKGTFIIKTPEHHLTVSRAQRARLSSLSLCFYETRFSAILSEKLISNIRRN